MMKIKKWLKKASTSGTLTSLALVVIAIAETNAMCAIWVFGQDDMPEELL